MQQIFFLSFVTDLLLTWSGLCILELGFILLVLSKWIETLTSHPVEDPVHIVLTSVSRSPTQSVFLCVPSRILNTFLLSSMHAKMYYPSPPSCDRCVFGEQYKLWSFLEACLVFCFVTCCLFMGNCCYCTPPSWRTTLYCLSVDWFFNVCTTLLHRKLKETTCHGDRRPQLVFLMFLWLGDQG